MYHPTALPDCSTPNTSLADRLQASRLRLCQLNKKFKKARRLLEQIRHSYELELSYYRELDRTLAEQDGRLKECRPKKARRKSVTKPKEFTLDLDKLLVGLSNEQQQLVRDAMKRQGLC